jgi:hypothetical protein
MKVPTAPMIETREIETAPGLVFDCSVGGDALAPLVLMLHGFCVSRYFWDNQIPVWPQRDILPWPPTNAATPPARVPTRPISITTGSTN